MLRRDLDVAAPLRGRLHPAARLARALRLPRDLALELHWNTIGLRLIADKLESE